MGIQLVLRKSCKADGNEKGFKFSLKLLFNRLYISGVLYVVHFQHVLLM